MIYEEQPMQAHDVPSNTAPVRIHQGCQTVYAADGVALFRGQWNPKLIFDVLSAGDPSFWRGKAVLEIAANTGGLSLEIARAGARSVVLCEPDPYKNNLALSRPILDELISSEQLPVIIRPDDFFGLVDNIRLTGAYNFDVIICLGLIYHFRYPQLMLDSLSSLRPEHLFISTQTHPSNDLALYNRRHPGILPKGFLHDEVVLSGWHPTRALFERMLAWAGFADITSLTTGDFKQQKPGLTNSAYYRARCVTPKDPEAEKRVYYPR